MDRGLSMKRNPSIYSSTRLCLSPSRVRSQTRMPKIDGCRGANPEIHFVVVDYTVLKMNTNEKMVSCA